jgi:hypothetical protein
MEERFPGRPWVRGLPWGLAVVGCGAFALALVVG